MWGWRRAELSLSRAPLAQRMRGPLWCAVGAAASPSWWGCASCTDVVGRVPAQILAMTGCLLRAAERDKHTEHRASSGGVYKMVAWREGEAEEHADDWGVIHMTWRIRMQATCTYVFFYFWPP